MLFLKNLMFKHKLPSNNFWLIKIYGYIYPPKKRLVQIFFRIFLFIWLPFFAWLQAYTQPTVNTTDYSDHTTLSAIDSMMVSRLYKQLGKTHTTYNHKALYIQGDESKTTPEEVYKERFARMNENSAFHFVYNAEVKQWLDLYVHRRKALTARMFGMAPLYFPVFEEMLDKFNMPLEIKYLAIVESALNAQAVSPAKAVGLWQFIPSTGLQYGLDNNYVYDGRMDLYKSTEAACRFMCDLYKEYKDWELVLAAYNCGPGNVNKAIRRSGGKTSFWEIMPHLPRETRGYVPAFIAVNYAMRYAAEHQIVPKEPVYSGYLLDTVCVKGPLSLSFVAQQLQVSLEELTFFNPQFKKGTIPNNDKYYNLYLPAHAAGLFVNNEQTLYALAANQKNPSTHSAQSGAPRWHIVRKGETLQAIANKYQCSTTQLKDWNNLKSSSLQAGQKLSVHQGQTKTSSALAHTPVQATKSTKSFHTVQSGDTLYKIALANGTTVEKLKELNTGLHEKNLKIGAKIKLQPVG